MSIMSNLLHRLENINDAFLVKILGNYFGEGVDKIQIKFFTTVP